MNIKDIRIGDLVQDKHTKFPMKVVGLFEDGLVYLDFDGNEGDVWENDIEDLEPCLDCPKYELTNETFKFSNITLHRIKALRDFGDVKAGDLGGYIEQEHNLSHKGKCWVYDVAMVFGNAKVCDNAKMYGSSFACDSAVVGENAMVFDKVRILNNATVSGYAEIRGNSIIRDYANVLDNASVRGQAVICDHAHVTDNANVCDNAVVCGEAIVCGMAEIEGSSKVGGAACIAEYAFVKDSLVKNACVGGRANLFGCEVFDNKDFIMFNTWWDFPMNFVWTRSNDMWKIGEIHCKSAELRKHLLDMRPIDRKNYEAMLKYVEKYVKEDDSCGKKSLWQKIKNIICE